MMRDMTRTQAPVIIAKAITARLRQEEEERARARVWFWRVFWHAARRARP